MTSKEVQKRYDQSDKGKARHKKHTRTEKRKASRKKHAQSDKGKASTRKYNQSDKGKAKNKERPVKMRLRVLKHYSKRLSKSDIPCCNCCGENSHIDFLSLDHIAGRKEMKSDFVLALLGYDSEKKGQVLDKWITDNNFPEGFQVLCHNCNIAKAYPRNKNRCPHQK